MKIKNLKGPSGVALGGAGVGYFEISPEGKLTRNCINNIHKSFTDTPKGFLLAVHDGNNAIRLQRDNDTLYGMKAYKDSFYTGLWPYLNIEFENNDYNTTDMGFTAFSGVAAHKVKLSSLPVVFYETELVNKSDAEKEMSAILTWGDIIGRGIRDTSVARPENPDGETGEWYDMDIPETFAKGATVNSGDKVYMGVKQYAKSPILPKKATFQNYNNSFMILAEKSADTDITVLKSFDVNCSLALSSFTEKGHLNDYDEREAPLSQEKKGGCRDTEKGSAVCVKANVPANSSKKLRFIVSWFMPEINAEQYASINKMEGCDYNKYYHNFFSNIEELTYYAINKRDEILSEIRKWQQPILESSLPDWLKLKIITSGYTLYSNGVLNKRGNFTTLEGEMGGYGGTMDQKMSSHPFYEKLFPMLNMQENLQFANVKGTNGEIQHFDVHYYHGLSDSNPNNRVNPTPAGSMIDNAGAWIVQMWNYYAQTGDKTYLEKHYDVMKTSMDFIHSKYEKGTHYPNYNTTYDDYTHPEILIFSGIVWLNMLDIASDWAALLGKKDVSESFKNEIHYVKADVEKLYGVHQPNLGLGGFYAFGCDPEYLASNKEKGSIKSEFMFSGAMAGQFISRYSGRGDLIPFENFVSHMNSFIRTSIQGSNDYYAPKVYNIRTEQSMDNAGSRCWPFYLDSYGGMAAIQAGYLEDGLEILRHTMRVHLNMGYLWTQNLWNPAYSTYMTAPVSWFISSVLAGAALNVPGKTLTLGPSCPCDNMLKTTLYYPKFWAEVNYVPDKKLFTFTVTHTFYENGETPIEINTLIASPAGKPSCEAKTIKLKKTFIFTEGAMLDLSENIVDFKGNLRPKLLKPVADYVTPKESRKAEGKGLSATLTFGENKYKFTAEEVNFRINKNTFPIKEITGEYLLKLEGKILPRYSQKYQLIFEYSGNEGDLELKFDGKEVKNYANSIDAVESQQFSPTENCKLLVFTTDLEADKLYDIELIYKGDLSKGENLLRFLWWSTTQNMGVVIKERLYS